MKRIACTLSIILLLSCSYMLEASPKRKRVGNQHPPVGAITGLHHKNENKQEESDTELQALITEKNTIQKQYNKKLLTIADYKLVKEQVQKANIDTESRTKRIDEQDQKIISTRQELQEYSAQLYDLSIKIKAMKEGWIATDANEPSSNNGWLSWLPWGSSSK